MKKKNTLKKTIADIQKEKKRSPRFFSLIVIFILSIIALLFAYFFPAEELITPLSQHPVFEYILGIGKSNSSFEKKVYGFLPYWEVDDAHLSDQLTDVAYFSLRIGATGSLESAYGEKIDAKSKNKVEIKQLDALKDKLKDKDVNIQIVLTQFLSDDIWHFLNSDNSQEKLLDNIDKLLIYYPIYGINIDIEYGGNNPSALRDKYTQFVKKFNKRFKRKYPDLQISIDTYAIAGSTNGFWDIQALEPYVDYIIIMAYDFHRRQSTVAGPVAPLFGAEKIYESDINKNIKGFFDKVSDKRKLILGVPFYGYGWQTTSRSERAHTYPETGFTARYRSVMELLDESNYISLQKHWNEEALSPYISYVKDGRTHIIYYDDQKSLSYKLDYVNILDIGGIAIWALGYEGDHPELWNVIEEKL